MVPQDKTESKKEKKTYALKRMVLMVCIGTYNFVDRKIRKINDLNQEV